MVPISDTDHILDIGFGDGRVLIELATASQCVCSGVEVDPALVLKAQAALRETSVETRCSLVQGDALRMGDSGSYSLFEYENHVWEHDGLSRPFSVIVMFLVPAALRKVAPLVRCLWERGGVTVVTLGAYHFDDWAYDRADLDLDVWIINPK